jgi:uncharacterized protein YbaR (Trm112 family)
MIAEELLALLRCPLTRQPLRMATPAELASLPGTPAMALIRGDGHVAYPIQDDIPMLIAEAAIPLGER